MALTLGEYAPSGTNLKRVLELLVLHDLVEVYAGDVHFDQSEASRQEQARRENEAGRDSLASSRPISSPYF